MSRIIKIYFFKIVCKLFILSFIGCKSIITRDVTDSPLVNGNNNFVINAPNKSTTYKSTSIHYEITQHYETINQIDKTITYYENYEKELDFLLKGKKIKKKKYFEEKSKVQNYKNEVKRKRTEAEKALSEWQNLYRTSSLEVEAEENRRERERLDAENRRIEIEKQRLSRKDAEINNKPIQPSASPSPKTIANGFVVGRNYCCNSDGYYLYCIRTETISQQELNEIKRQRDNNTYTEENDRTLIRCLQQGEEVQLLGEKGGWFKVYDIQSQKTGYMSKKIGNRLSLASCD